MPITSDNAMKVIRRIADGTEPVLSDVTHKAKSWIVFAREALNDGRTQDARDCLAVAEKLLS